MTYRTLDLDGLKMERVVIATHLNEAEKHPDLEWRAQAVKYYSKLYRRYSYLIQKMKKGEILEARTPLIYTHLVTPEIVKVQRKRLGCLDQEYKIKEIERIQTILSELNEYTELKDWLIYIYKPILDELQIILK